MKASGIGLQDFDTSGGNRDSTLGGHTQSSVCIRTQQEGTGTPWETEPDLPALEGLLWSQGTAVAHHGDKDTGSRSSGKYSGCEPSQSLPLAQPKGLWAPVLGRLRPNNQQEANSAPPISRQADYSFTELCPPEQHPALPTTSPSHQEAQIGRAHV